MFGNLNRSYQVFQHPGSLRCLWAWQPLASWCFADCSSKRVASEIPPERSHADFKSWESHLWSGAMFHGIGVREILQELNTLYLIAKTMVSCRFSLIWTNPMNVWSPEGKSYIIINWFSFSDLQIDPPEISTNRIYKSC